MSAETTASRFDSVKWIIVTALLAVAVVGNSYFSDQSLLYRVLGIVAISAVAGVRGQLGAYQNRLQSTMNNLAVETENLQAAESMIRDVDVAFETAQLTKNAITQQAALSVLAQANIQPQNALSLLG